jgi:hypothetical protein
VRWWIRGGAGAALAGVLLASPVDFGMEELRAALAERDRTLSIQTELSLDPPGSFRIVPLRGGVRISGGDLRGLMYGLIEAAEQIRESGAVKDVRKTPALASRGVRVTPTDLQLLSPSFFHADAWRDYFRMLARSRIDRFTLVAPPAALELDRVRFLARTAADFGVDFVLGLRVPLGTARELYGRLRLFLDQSLLVRGLEIEAGAETLEFYQSSVIRAVKETGRRVTLDVHGAARPEVARAALEAGVYLRATDDPGAAGRFWERHGVLRAPEVTADPDLIRRHLTELAGAKAAGFEVDAPGPGAGGYQQLFWWWGRLGYDQGTRIAAAGAAAAGRPAGK